MPESADAIKPESAASKFEPVAGPVHTLILLLVLAAVAAVGYVMTRRQANIPNPNHLLFYVPTMIWEWLLFGYVYWGVRRRGKSFRDIAGERWTSVVRFLLDFGIAAGFWFVALIILFAVSRLVPAPGMREAAMRMAPQGLLETLLWIGLSITAGICEETIFRGYLQRQFIAWFRNAPVGVLLSAALFGLGHVYQGLPATVTIGVYGLLFGILAELRGNLRPGMLTHAWHDSITGLSLEFLVKHGRSLRAG
jgi:uncharacterized protein